MTFIEELGSSIILKGYFCEFCFVLGFFDMINWG